MKATKNLTPLEDISVKFIERNSNKLIIINLFILTKYHMFWLSYECFSRVNTVKPKYNNHLGDKVSEVVIDR